jgi:hypothetical protein
MLQIFETIDELMNQPSFKEIVDYSFEHIIK